MSFFLHSEVIFCLNDASCRPESKMSQNVMGFMPTYERAISASARALVSCWGEDWQWGSWIGAVPGSCKAAQPLSGMGRKWETLEGLCHGQGIWKVAGRGQGGELGHFPSHSRSSSIWLSSLPLSLYLSSKNVVLGTGLQYICWYPTAWWQALLIVLQPWLTFIRLCKYTAIPAKSMRWVSQNLSYGPQIATYLFVSLSITVLTEKAHFSLL